MAPCTIKLSNQRRENSWYFEFNRFSDPENWNCCISELRRSCVSCWFFVSPRINVRICFKTFLNLFIWFSLSFDWFFDNFRSIPLAGTWSPLGWCEKSALFWKETSALKWGYLGAQTNSEFAPHWKSKLSKRAIGWAQKTGCPGTFGAWNFYHKKTLREFGGLWRTLEVTLGLTTI